MTKKRCTKCGGEFARTRDYFNANASSLDGLRGVCVVCSREYFRRRHQRQRWAALVCYGGPSPSCACCGEAEEAFLTIDHIAGGGNRHRKAQKTQNLPDILRRDGYPPGFQILCWNCNLARSTRGCCPHEIQRIEEAAA